MNLAKASSTRPIANSLQGWTEAYAAGVFSRVRRGAVCMSEAEWAALLLQGSCKLPPLVFASSPSYSQIQSFVMMQ